MSGGINMSKSNYRTHISSSCLDLEIGETTRDVQCPFCLKQDGDFAVTRIQEGLLYRCFRVKCDKSGIIKSDNGQWEVASLKKSLSRDYPFESDVGPLRESHISFLMDNFNFTMEDIKNNKIKWCNVTDRVIYPILSEKGIIKGYVARYYKELNENKSYYPKAKTYWINRQETDPSIAFPYTKSTTLGKDGIKTYVLVEDIPSAICLAKYISSIALISNCIPYNALTFLMGKNIIIMLDNDATTQAIKLCKKYSLFFNQCEVFPINVDPKNMSEEQIKKVVAEIELL